MSKKILFIVNVDWFFISHRLPIALEAKKRGYEVHIACGMTNKEEYLKNLGFIVHPLSLSRGGKKLFDEIKTFFSIFRILKKVNADIVHFISIKPILYGGIASRFLNIEKKVFSISGLGYVFIAKGSKAEIVKTLIIQLYKFALGGVNTHVIVQNEDDKKVVLDLNVLKESQITLIKGSGVNLDQYQFVQEKVSTKPIVVMASRLLKDKGVWEYVEASRLLISKGINAQFKLYGDIDISNPASLNEDEITAIVDEEVVEVEGFSEDIASVFQQANIVVLPSYREGLPKVLIEAAACGRAVVTTDVPGCQDAIVQDVTGLLCQVRDSVSLAKTIEKLIVDDKLRRYMGKAGRELAEKEFDIKNVVKKHFNIYES